MEIKVTIPPRQFSWEKYTSENGQTCYLEDALIEAGYKNVSVGGCGLTKIDGINYIPTERFTCEVVREAFSKNQSITVTLMQK